MKKNNLMRRIIMKKILKKKNKKKESKAMPTRWKSKKYKNKKKLQFNNRVSQFQWGKILQWKMRLIWAVREIRRFRNSIIKLKNWIKINSNGIKWPKMKRKEKRIQKRKRQMRNCLKREEWVQLRKRSRKMLIWTCFLFNYFKKYNLR